MPELRRLPIDQVEEPEATPRELYDEAGILELAASIREVGLLQPIGVRRDGSRYVRVFGKRRLLACRWLGHVEIDCTVLSAQEACEFEAATAENIQRRDLTPVEEARALRYMIEVRGRSVREVAQSQGKSESWVRARLEILLWPVEVAEHVARGELAVSVARELIGVEDLVVRAHYVRCAVESGCTAATARQWRVDWELSRPVPGQDVGASVPGAVAPAPMIPEVCCQVCDVPQLVTSLGFLRVCGSCIAAVQAEKAQARGGAA